MSTATYRHLLALPRGERRVLLSWRLLRSDPPDTPFTVERRRGAGDAWQPVSGAPITGSTCALDEAPEPETYEYRVVGPGGPSETVRADAGAAASMHALDVPLDPEEQVAGIALGDLENDGRLGYVLRATRGGTVWICAYSHTGQRLWARDTRLPAAGGWDGSTLHVPLLAWDLNGDGRTEVAFHTCRGPFPRERYDEGGADELLTVVDGATGELVWEAPWPARRPRVMMTVGHLRGLDRPAAIVVQDETYGDETLTAVDGASGATLWQVQQARPGGHNLDIADIDGDGAQEVICGGVCYNGDGSIRWEAEPFGHTDISKPAKIVPELDGLQIWYAVESHNPGVYLVDRSGRTLWKEPFRHAHYGWVARHAPGVPGLHPHAAEDGRSAERLSEASALGHDMFPIYLPDSRHWLNLTDWQRKNLVPVHWDEGPEVVFIVRKDDKRVVRLRPDGEIEDVPEGRLPAGGRYGRNLACADIVGDFRENIATVDEERHRLIVLANPTPATRRGYSPWEDFAYRHDRSQLASGYYIYLSPPDTALR